jgi:hypothetical protein
MRPNVSYLVASIEADRHRGEERRHALHRALADAGPTGPSWPERLRDRILSLVRRDHSLTDYPCRLPDGGIGRVAVVPSGGDWALVCRTA